MWISIFASVIAIAIVFKRGSGHDGVKSAKG